MTDTAMAFDLAVIGGGSGGLACAKRAAALGARVVVAEADRVGGTCVIRGCIPKKLMVYAAELGRSRQLAAAYGWSAPGAGDAERVDWERLCSMRNRTVNNLELAHTRHLAQANVRLVAGHASLLPGPAVTVAGETFPCRHVLLACGGTPRLPDVPGGREHCVSSDGFFTLPTLPRQAVVIGGGYIAVEFACLLRALGAQVALVVRSQLLRGFDVDLREGMLAALRLQGIAVHGGMQLTEIARAADGSYRVELTGEGGRRTLACDAPPIAAVGRRPQAAALGAAAAGVALDARGAVRVDAEHRTSMPNVYAVGDAIDRVNLTPMAIRAGRSVAEGLFGAGFVQVDYAGPATAVFGHPAIGTVGLTEAQARARPDADVRIFRSRFVPLRYTPVPAPQQVASATKLVVDAASDRVLGVHMIGDDAPEIIQGFAAALQAGITKAQLDATLAVHPTQAEEFVLMR